MIITPDRQHKAHHVVRDGQIVTSRDYHNHPVLADAAAERLP